MKPRLGLLAIVIALAVTAGTADAKPVAFSKSYETKKKFGIGFGLGVPSSLTGKLFLNPAFAIDFGIGANLFYRQGFHVNADITWNPFVAIEGETFLAPLYLGIGGRFLQADGSYVGVRIPVGLSFDFAKKPLEIFSEVAFVFDFLAGDADGRPVDFNSLIGLRYYL